MSKLIDPAAIAVATIWQEARNQPHEGRIAVAEVIRRRADTGFHSDGTIIGACLAPLQFSGWNAKDPNRIPSLKIDTTDPIVLDCMKAWEASAFTDLSHGADSYVNLTIVKPDWYKPTLVTAVIGDHSFLRLR